MYSAAGTGGISTRSPLERYVRDGQALRHPVAAAETRDETVGQVHLGLPPNLPALTCYAPGAGEGGRSGGL
jgi:indole-3-acetate monooxygenase